jgi:hypothetical protein
MACRERQVVDAQERYLFRIRPCRVRQRHTAKVLLDVGRELGHGDRARLIADCRAMALDDHFQVVLHDVGAERVVDSALRLEGQHAASRADHLRQRHSKGADVRPHIEHRLPRSHESSKQLDLALGELAIKIKRPTDETIVGAISHVAIAAMFGRVHFSSRALLLRSPDTISLQSTVSRAVR